MYSVRLVIRRDDDVPIDLLELNRLSLVDLARLLTHLTRAPYPPANELSDEEFIEYYRR
jgi:hypothetical protein